MPISSIINKTVYLVFLLLIILQLHNAVSLPINRGFDAQAHLDYVHFLKTQKRIPLPTDGWEMYQPPLYYLVLAALSSSGYIPILRFFEWGVFIIITYIFLRKTDAPNSFRLPTAMLISCLPVIIYMSLSVGNEFFSTIFISLALIYYQISINSKNLIRFAILGIVLGIGLLAKSTTLMIILCITINEFVRGHKKPKDLAKTLGVMLGIIFLVAGWFYVRNLFLYHNPLAAASDFPRQFPLLQSKIPLSSGFFLNLKPFLTMDLFQAQYYSFIGGTYFSWFYDGHNIIIPPQAFSKAGMFIVALSIPIFIIGLKGYFLELKKVTYKNRVLLLYPLLLIISYFLYFLKLPFYSTVKGAFLVSLAIPFGYFFLKEISLLQRYGSIICFYIVIYCLLIIKNFWILKSWYR